MALWRRLCRWVVHRSELQLCLSMSLWLSLAQRSKWAMRPISIWAATIAAANSSLAANSSVVAI